MELRLAAAIVCFYFRRACAWVGVSDAPRVPGVTRAPGARAPVVTPVQVEQVRRATRVQAVTPVALPPLPVALAV